ncbi:MAG: sodium-dependent transporter [Prevotellaceae bacterium]|nr:sodium-dependent transporter [Prevotellaceae bacterium]
MEQERGNFGSKIGAVLAAAGSAVGLGNIWRFPTEVGNNGGAAFFIIYLVCVLFVGLPVMVSEFVIGRHTHANTITAFRRLAPGTWWRVTGVEGVFVAFLILSYYIIVGGWTLHYSIASLANRLSVNQDFGEYFSRFSSSAWEPVVYAVVFMGIVHLTIVGGVKDGIERFSKVMMPILLLIIGILVICSFSMSGFTQGMVFLLKPDFSSVTPGVALSAIGQAFYSLSLAMGCLCTYASYFDGKTNLMKTALSVVTIDTIVAVLAAFIVFPAVFSVGVEPDAGPGLVFITLPNVFNIAFHSVPVVGYVFSGLFYVLLFLAALTSAISLHEPVTAYLHEEWHISRRTAAWLVTVSCSLLGVACSLSFGPWRNVTIGGMTIFDLFDFLSAKIIIPLGGVLIALFVGWRLDRQLVENEITNQGKLRIPFIRFFMFLVRWVAPLAIAVIFVNELFF